MLLFIMTNHDIKSLIVALQNTSNATPLFEIKNCVKLAKIVDVYDGDTAKACFSLDGSCETIYRFIIRMHGYDSEEIRQLKNEPLRDEKKKLALLQKKALEDMILNKLVFIDCLGHDKYGRILGKIYLDAEKIECVNDRMINEHGCKVYLL
jgi:endonuclease YncB( thermonuclease family)